MPGHVIGTITRRNDCSRPAPSIIAASSISRGISMKKLRSIQMVKGWFTATSVRISSR